MKTSDRGRALIEHCEGLQTAAYPDPGSALYLACRQRGISPYDHGYRALQGWEQLSGNPWTIGYGRAHGVKPGDECTAEQADAWLAEDLAIAEEAVNRLVEMQISQNEFDALASFTFNVGGQAFGASTLLRLLNVGEIAAAAAQFPRWVHDARGNVEPGLVTRRAMERALFEEKDDEQGS